MHASRLLGGDVKAFAHAALTVRHRSFTAERLTAKLEKELSEFVGAAPQFDDITALTLFYRGKSDGSKTASEIN